ncbi:hypothetical protein ACLVWQ_02310 [Streptomyces sp. CWNU-52B]|uniref:hypothetical protein n=1 Tax=unclassified Streptomyces TaxID=2593676 RepID=UPI0039BFFA6C
MADRLVIPIDGTDNGSRPWPDTNTTKTWDNNSLWLRTFTDPQHPHDPNYPVDSNTTRVGEETTVMVRVRNKGSDPALGVKIQAWLFPPGFGEMKTSSAYMGFDLTPARDIPAGTTLDIRVPPIWKPSEPEYQRTSGGHFCIAANCYQSDTVANPEGKLLGVNDTVRPSTDQHHAQRNIVLLPAPQGSGTSSKVPTTTYPPPGGSQQYLVSAEHVTTKPSAGQLAMLVHHPGIVATEADLARGEISLNTSRGPVPVTVGTEPPGFTLRSDHIPGLDTLFGFAADRPDRVDTDIVVERPKDAPVGSLHTFDLALWSERGDMIGSALRVMLLVTE